MKIQATFSSRQGHIFSALHPQEKKNWHALFADIHQEKYCIFHPPDTTPIPLECFLSVMQAQGVDLEIGMPALARALIDKTDISKMPGICHFRAGTG